MWLLLSVIIAFSIFTVPWQIRDAMDLRASDVISFEYGSFGEDVIVLRRELCADGGIDDCEYPCNPDNPDGGGQCAEELAYLD